MAKTKLSHRAFALSLAALFLVTSLGFSVLVVWQLVHQPKTPTVDLTTQTKLAGKPLANFTPTGKIGQLKTIDLKPGKGPAANAGATVSVQYSGAIASTGLVFESSRDSGQPATVVLKSGPDGVIAGWAKGLPGLKVGGIRRLLIPAALAYGSTGSPPDIGPNTDLVFDVELVSINSP